MHKSQEFFEVNNLIPNNQHGFRSNRSTMTVWCEMQEDWAKNTESKNMTGILLWDLSAAFDTLDPDLLCKKLKIYGFDDISISWFFSFLTDRSQKVKISLFTSIAIKLTSGVPQGGIILPLLYIIFVADLNLWLKSWVQLKDFQEQKPLKNC